MALDQDTNAAGEKKNLYDVGELPPVGHVPEQMYAWTIRRERHGEPDKAFEIEVVDVPKPDSNEVKPTSTLRVPMRLASFMQWETR